MIKNILKSFGIAVLMVLFPIVASVIIQVNLITDETVIYGIQAIFFLLASIIGYVIYRKNKNISYAVQNSKTVLSFIPLIFIELIVFTSGVNVNNALSYYFVLLLFTIFVGISEELFFRGIILNILKENGVKFSIYVSSILFAILHLTNIAGGSSINYVLLQVVFAFLFGLVAAQITIITKSILPAIIWHFSHDFIAFVTGNELNQLTLTLLVIQCIVLLLYAIYLNKRVIVKIV